MSVLQACNQAFLLAGSLLVRIRKREEEYKYKQYKVKNTAADEKTVVGGQSGSVCCNSHTEYERQEHLRDRDEEFNAHRSDARSLVDDLGNCRVDAGVKE